MLFRQSIWEYFYYTQMYEVFMKASETSLRNLLEGGKQFQIPLFQRPYAWEKKNWETLWDDIMSLYNGEVEGSYFLGPIVTQAIPGTADGISPFVVIDGQQRLITLTILLATLRHHLLKQRNDSLADELYELYLINKFKSNDDFYKVLPTQDDRKVYQNIILKKELTELQGKSKLLEAYNYFDNQIHKLHTESETSLELAKLKVVVLENLRLVNITSEDEDNPYLIFESLNHKGQALTQADLVRNYIFMKLPTEKRKEIYQSEWLPFQEQFKKVIYSSGSTDRVKLILERLENFQCKEPVDPLKLNIEHIMPQKLTSEWKTSIGSNYENIQKQYLHVLGNLTLTGYNPELSNKSFEEKRLIYKESNVSLNKYFQKIENWNVDSIQERAKYLANIAVQVWSR